MLPKKILLIISGSIAAYKSLDLIRRLREQGSHVQCILTRGGAEFVTPLSVASLSGLPVYSDLFSLKDETEMGHIRLSREADLILVAPASADLLAKMAVGRADDLATSALLATDKPVLVAPAMNHKMWEHPATQRNVKQLGKDGVVIIPPGKGDLACGEKGSGRMAETETILHALENFWKRALPLSGKRILVTSGPTLEAIDPVRFIGNRSSGKQGHAIAAALAARGADVTLVSGPVTLPDPNGVHTLHVESAEEMFNACNDALPCEVAIFSAAVADWRVTTPSAQKIKKTPGGKGPELSFAENPDILHSIAHLKQHRPPLVIGFAAETENVEDNAREKITRKGCDWVLANDVSGGRAFGADDNEILFVTKDGLERWERMSKRDIAEKLAEKIAATYTPIRSVKAIS